MDVGPALQPHSPLAFPSGGWATFPTLETVPHRVVSRLSYHKSTTMWGCNLLSWLLSVSGPPNSRCSGNVCGMAQVGMKSGKCHFNAVPLEFLWYFDSHTRRGQAENRWLVQARGPVRTKEKNVPVWDCCTLWFFFSLRNRKPGNVCEI